MCPDVCVMLQTVLIMKQFNSSHAVPLSANISIFNAYSFTMSYFFIASSLMNNTRRLFYTARTSSPGEILNIFISDRVCAAIVGMNYCNVLYAFVM